MDWLSVALFFAGLGLLVVGAGWLVSGASNIATRAGVSPLVVGLTVVAFGTSAPELAVSMKAALLGQADMAFGNAIGSNIFNVFVVLGLSAAVTPLVVARDLVRRDVPVMIALSVLLLLLALDGGIGRLDGLALVALLVGYAVWIVRQSRREEAAAKVHRPDEPPRPGSLPASIGLAVAGLAALVIGSGWLVDGAVSFAQWIGISEVVVGLTVVAAGTSLPELATSVLAAARGQRDIAVGNVVGSNVFNILGVLGVSGAMADGGLPVRPSMLALDLPLMIAAAFACLPLWSRARTIPRWQGAMFLTCYVAYVVYLVLDESQHEARSGYQTVMLRFVVPILGITLALIAWQTWRLPRRLAN